MAKPGRAPSGKAVRPLRPQPLWVRVDQNRAKLAVFVSFFVLGSSVLLTAAMIGVPGFLFGLLFTADEPEYAAWYWHDLGVVATVAFGLMLALGALASAVQLSNAEDWVRNRFKGKPAGKGEQPGFQGVVEDIAIAAGLKTTPAVVVLESTAINAYALGTSRESAVIGVTRGLLDTLPPAEQRAVVAALVARVVSGDIWFSTALAALMGPLKLVRESGKTLARGGAGCASSGCADGCSMNLPDDSCAGCLFDDVDSGCLGSIVTFFILLVIAAITYLAVVSAAWVVTIWGHLLHRTAYEKSDAEGMLLLKDPTPMLAALERAVGSDTTMAEGDASYDGIFYTSTSGTPALERVERRRLRRLAEVLGPEGAMAADRAT